MLPSSECSKCLMKIVTIGIAAIAAALCTPASAADMAVKAPQTVPESASVSGWSGFYVGGNAGYGWHDPTVSFSANDPAAAFATCGGLVGGTCPPSASFNIDGGLVDCRRGTIGTSVNLGCWVLKPISIGLEFGVLPHPHLCCRIFHQILKPLRT